MPGWREFGVYVATGLVVAVSVPTQVAAQPADAAVGMRNFSFAPKTITVPAGATVTWTNDDEVVHSVTADDKAWDSGTLQPDGTFAYTFAEPGTYPYYCIPHGSPGVGMTGTVIVTSPDDGDAALPAD